MRGLRFEETRSGRDVCHQRYVREDKSGHCPCARLRGMRFNESGLGRICAHVTSVTYVLTIGGVSSTTTSFE